MEFGEKIRELRKKKKMTSSELAEKAFISQSYLSQLETGKNKNPTNKIIRKLANGLDVNYIELLQKAGYIDEAEKEGMFESAKLFRENREKEELKDIAIPNNEIIDLGELIEAAYLNTVFQYKGDQLALEEKVFIADMLRIILNNDIPYSKEDKQKALTLIDTILK